MLKEDIIKIDKNGDNSSRHPNRPVVPFSKISILDF